MIYAYSGSRGIDNIDISKYIKNDAEVVITGGAIGVDRLVDKYADLKGINKITIRPEYEKFGRWAPLKRNQTIVEKCDCLIAIWDGKSRGTKFTIEYAKKIGKPVELYIID